MRAGLRENIQPKNLSQIKFEPNLSPDPNIFLYNYPKIPYFVDFKEGLIYFHHSNNNFSNILSLLFTWDS